MFSKREEKYKSHILNTERMQYSYLEMVEDFVIQRELFFDNQIEITSNFFQPSIQTLQSSKFSSHLNMIEIDMLIQENSKI